MQEMITPQGEKKYTSAQFATLTGIARGTLRRWCHEGKLIPAEKNGRRKPSYYYEYQIEEARQLRLCSIKEKTSNIINLFSEQTARADNATVGSDSTREDEFPTDEDNADEKFQDPPTVNQKSLETGAEHVNEAKNFLSMTITPNFDAIPQILKDLQRWLCWQLIPAEPKPKKVPMTPKYGKLVKASVTKSENWLSFDEALDWYNRGLCTGIGFALTNTPPKVCCVDVDHCFNSDGTLTDEARAVVETCQNSFTEKSQSGTGIHVWFVDEDFHGGRRKGNVEVYAADRYIAFTGVRVSSATQLLTVNGACQNVITKFIDDNGENLFDKPARTVDEKSEINFVFDTNVLMTDDDRRLVEYFGSEKCREHDLNMFELFSGDKENYFKNTGKPVDDSVADCDLMLKILYYITGAEKDAEIWQRALHIFSYSTLAKRPKWLEREDYRFRTLNAAFGIWNKNGRKTIKPMKTDGSAQFDDLQADLREINKQLSDFDAEKNTALEKLRNLEKFGFDDVTDDEIINATGFARVFEPALYTGLRHDIKLWKKSHSDDSVDMNDFGRDTKDRAEEIQKRYDKLLARRNEIQAQINTQKFIAKNDLISKFAIPAGYCVTANGVEKIKGKHSELVCRRPVIITGTVYSVEEKTHMMTLGYQTAEGKWKNIAPTEGAIVFNARKLVDLRSKGLPVTSQNAGMLVDYLDAFCAENESQLSMTYSVARCGWHKFNGRDHFIDPRRDCVIQDDDKNISVKADDSRSDFARHLKQVGDLEKWKKAYELAKKSPVARLTTAASVAPILLKVLGERNFLLYIYAPTRAGKTTALYLGASAVGSEKIIRSFDATKNGLAGAAADVNDFVFCVDEKQVADNRISEQMSNLIYALANGIGRTKLNRDSTLKKTQDWRTIAIMTGETLLLPDNVTGGANTRLLSINAPKEILDAETCKIIRDTITDNYGLAFPLVVDKVLEFGRDKLRGVFEEMVDTFAEAYSDLLPEYRRYMAVLTLADTLLNSALFGNTVVAEDGRILKASDDAIINAAKIFKLIPTTNEISDTPREKDFVCGFINQNQSRFIGGNVPTDRMQIISGILRCGDGFSYITSKALSDACAGGGFDYRKLVNDLVAIGFFVPANTIEKGRKTPLATVQKQIGATYARCYRIPNTVLGSAE